MADKFNYEIAHEYLWNHLFQDSNTGDTTFLRKLAATGNIDDLKEYINQTVGQIQTNPNHPLHFNNISSRGFTGGTKTSKHLNHYTEMMKDSIEGVIATLETDKGLDIASKGGIVNTVGGSGGKADITYSVNGENVYSQSLKKGQSVIYSAEAAFQNTLEEAAKKTIKDPKRLNKVLEQIKSFTEAQAGTKGLSTAQQKLKIGDHQTLLNSILENNPDMGKEINRIELGGKIGDVDDILYVGGGKRGPSRVFSIDEALDQIQPPRVRSGKGYVGKAKEGVNRIHRQMSVAGDAFKGYAKQNHMLRSMSKYSGKLGTSDLAIQTGMHMMSGNVIGAMISGTTLGTSQVLQSPAVQKRIAGQIAELAAKRGGKSALKLIPGLDVVLSGMEAYGYLAEGKLDQAGIAALSGAIGWIPIIGDGAAAALDLTNTGIDISRLDFNQSPDIDMTEGGKVSKYKSEILHSPTGTGDEAFDKVVNALKENPNRYDASGLGNRLNVDDIGKALSRL